MDFLSDKMREVGKGSFELDKDKNKSESYMRFDDVMMKLFLALVEQ